ncbi:MAG: HAD family hydrolase [Prevotella sp.]|nr:HAD family hydrolase [Prevotella sp.]
MKYNTYIFDLDGTLLNTLADLTASTNYALRSCDMPEHSTEEVRRFVGNGVRKLMERAVPGGTANARFEEVLATFRSHYLAHGFDTTAPYPGIMEMLTALKEAGRKVAVVSNKLDAATKQLCTHYFGALVPVAIGEQEALGIRRKPAPDTVRKALEELGASDDGAVYVGDSEVDIMTARNCGMPCISVSWGFKDREFLMEHGAAIIVETPEEILNV